MSLFQLKKLLFGYPFVVSLYLSMAAFLVFWKSPSSGFGDDGIYISAGQRLVQGDVIYRDGFRSGPFGALTMFTVSKVFPQDVSWIIFQIIYIGCVSGIVFLLTQRFPAPYRLLISVFAISSAPMREHLHNHQITALVTFLALWPFLVKREHWWVKAAALLSCSFAVDLKPQIALVVIVVLSVYSRNFKIVLYSGLFSICAHLVISAARAENVTFEWVSFLLNLSQNNSWGESIYIWPLFEILNIDPILLHIFEYAAILTVIVWTIKGALDGNLHNCLIGIGVFTYFLSYSHFYDLILLATLAILKAFTNPNARSFLFMAFAIMPGGITELPNLVFWIAMFALYVLAVEKVSNLIAGISISIGLLPLLDYVISSSLSTTDQQVRFRASAYFILAVILFLKFPKNFKVQSNQE
jgi:hypothetical protein